jgi:hypothetical protein
MPRCELSPKAAGCELSSSNHETAEALDLGVPLPESLGIGLWTGLLGRELSHGINGELDGAGIAALGVPLSDSLGVPLSDSPGRELELIDPDILTGGIGAGGLMDWSGFYGAVGIGTSCRSLLGRERMVATRFSTPSMKSDEH